MLYRSFPSVADSLKSVCVCEVDRAADLSVCVKAPLPPPRFSASHLQGVVALAITLSKALLRIAGNSFSRREALVNIPVAAFSLKQNFGSSSADSRSNIHDSFVIIGRVGFSLQFLVKR